MGTKALTVSGRSISVNGELYERITKFAERKGIAVRSLIEAIIAPILTGAEPIPVGVPERAEWLRERSAKAQPKPAAAIAERERVHSTAKVREALEVIRNTPRYTGLPESVRVAVSAELLEDFEAQLERRTAAGLPELDLDTLGEQAITRMLDEYETLPPGILCSQCTNKIAGAARLLPASLFKPGAKPDARVWVCWDCDTEHPRKGRYGFSGGRASDIRAQSAVRTGGRDGAGNKREGGR